MKKLFIFTGLCAAAFSAQAFDQARFDTDTGYYNLYRGAAKSITILLSPFNTDNGVRQAFDLYGEGDETKLKQLASNFEKAKVKADEISVSSYFLGCSGAVLQAHLMWDYATKMYTNDFGEWDNPEALNLKQYKTAKKNFETEFRYCKQAANNAPDKKDYERKIIALGE